MLLLYIIVLCVSFSLLSYRLAWREKNERLRKTSQTAADMVEAVTELSNMDSWQLSVQLTSVSRATGNHIIVCDADGSVWLCSDGLMRCEHLGKTVSQDILFRLRQSNQYSEYSDLDAFYSEVRNISGTAIIDSDGEFGGAVFSSDEPDSIGQVWKGTALIMLLALCFVLLVAIPVGIANSKKETKPLRELANAARQFAKGNLSVRVSHLGREDEVGELAEAFNQMADSLEKAEKSRMDFVANVSHELKTPMTTISGYADGLLDGTIPMSSADHYLAIISDETKRLSRLVRQMLQISRMQDGAFLRSGAFDASEVIRMAIINLEPKISAKQLTLCPELPEDALMTRGNADAVSQVIYNILDNAVKFAEESSRLEIKLYKQNGKAYVSVVDRGETIPAAELPDIFLRFHKSDRSRSLDRDGVGLGLYIVKTILDGLGEDIWVRSKDGETEFRFTLSLSDA